VYLSLTSYRDFQQFLFPFLSLPKLSLIKSQNSPLEPQQYRFTSHSTMKVLVIFSVFSLALAGSPTFNPSVDICKSCQNVYVTQSYPSFCGCSAPEGSTVYGIEAVPTGYEVTLYGCCEGSYEPDANVEKLWTSFVLVDPSQVAVDETGADGRR
jgi:hypothetical protein